VAVSVSDDHFTGDFNPPHAELFVDGAPQGVLTGPYSWTVTEPARGSPYILHVVATDGVPGHDVSPVDRSVTVVTTPPVWQRVQDNGSGIAYAGSGWAAASNGCMSGGTYRHSRGSGDTATFSFTGTRVRWIGAVWTDHGTANVLVDGVPKGTIDTYGSPACQTVLFTSDVLGSGGHTLQIKVNGVKSSASTDTWVDVDAFDFQS
jgi:hypothetical protein